ncbi:hypothetical protein OZX73_00805 [Bifidobacterium sp. ESL0775]|uniref:hypothetical protein n=1 Tax=Bifidobacterium sp. ESL0775 TaxID=2983230 RepID=UPI0023F86B8D|nr:hypothetical protein [Bifidobacterium sp. ESL0775]WEV69471.1 hypothetical protein OZX73_00805 [Bifidobacterium sp. ESL0775]
MAPYENTDNVTAAGGDPLDRIAADMLDPGWFATRQEEYTRLCESHPELRDEDHSPEGLDGLICYMVLKSCIPDLDPDSDGDKVARLVLACLTGDTGSNDDGGDTGGDGPTAQFLPRFLHHRRKRDEEHDEEPEEHVVRLAAKYLPMLRPLASRINDLLLREHEAAKRRKELDRLIREEQRKTEKAAQLLEKAERLINEATTLREQREFAANMDGNNRELKRLIHLACETILGHKTVLHRLPGQHRLTEVSLHNSIYGLNWADEYLDLRFKQGDERLMTGEGYRSLSPADQQGWQPLYKRLSYLSQDLKHVSDQLLQEQQKEIERASQALNGPTVQPAANLPSPPATHATEPEPDC